MEASTMRAKIDLTLKQEIDFLLYDVRRWSDLFPYEKDYLLRRTHELVLQHKDILGEDLTKSLISSINTLSISR